MLALYPGRVYILFVVNTPGGYDDAFIPERRAKAMKTEETTCCCETGGTLRHKIRTDEQRKALMRRLSIIEGQIRGIRGMLEKDIYCIDILTQVSAANCALNSFSRELLAEHMRTCVAEDIREGSSEKMEELMKLLPKLMK